MKHQLNHIRLLSIALAKTPNQQNRGYVLIVVLGIGVALLGLLSAYAVAARTERMGVLASRDSGTGFSAAEAGLNLRAEGVRREFENFSRPSGTAPSEAYCASSDLNAANDFRCINYNFEDTTGPDRIVSTYMQDITQCIANSQAVIGTGCEPKMSRVPNGQAYQGLSMQEYAYKVVSIARRALQLDDQGRITENSPIEGMMEMEVKSRLIPMFQFAAFYKNDLEITPGPQMQFNGPIHTNSRLMLAGWFGADGALRINGQITVARPGLGQHGQIFNAVAADNCRTAGNCNLLTRTNDNRRVQIRNSSNTAWVNLLEAGSGATTPTNAVLSRFQDANNPLNTQVQVNLNPVSLPSFGEGNSFLRCTSTDRQNVCTKADINIAYNPATISNSSAPTPQELSVVPFTVGVRNQSSSATVLGTRTLSVGELRSMRQPVLVTTENTGGTRIPGTRGSVTTGTNTTDARPILSAGVFASAADLQGVCAATTIPSDLATYLGSNATDNTLLATNRTQIQNALRVALVSQLRPIQFNELETNLRDANGAISAAAPNPFTGSTPDLLSFRFQESLRAQLGVSTSNNIILALRRGSMTNPLPSMNTVAAVAGGSCFVSAPIQEITRFENGREGRMIRLLQMNIASTAIWNRDGRFVSFNGIGNTADTIASSNNGAGFRASDAIDPLTNDGISSFLYRVLAPESAAPGEDSFQEYGYASADQSNGGMVVHFEMANGITYPARQSPYGFMLMGGRQLFGRAIYQGASGNPYGVTFASSQAIYVQGDFNNFLTDPSNATFTYSNPTFNAHNPNSLMWQPSSILADSINVFSNACRNTLFDRVVKTSTADNCNAQNDSNATDGTTGSRPAASSTTTRVAFLSGTDITGSTDVPGFSGGIQNYPRYQENWGNDDLHIYSGSFVSLGTPSEVSGRWDAQPYSPPQRLWAYDTRFNNAANLPPITPRFVAMQQEVFRRRFRQ